MKPNLCRVKDCNSPIDQRAHYWKYCTAHMPTWRTPEQSQKWLEIDGKDINRGDKNNKKIFNRTQKLNMKNNRLFGYYSERDLQNQSVAALRSFFKGLGRDDISVWDTSGVPREAGRPDLTIIHLSTGRALAIEFKTAWNPKLSPHQKQVLDRIRDEGHIVGIATTVNMALQFAQLYVSKLPRKRKKSESATIHQTTLF